MRSTRRTLVAAVAAVTTLGGITSAAASPPTVRAVSAPTTDMTGAEVEPAGGPSVRTVTLITGDVVHLTTLLDGRHSVSVEATGSASQGRFTFTEQDGHVQIVPVEAFPYLADGQLDPALFDITTLIAQGYDDDRSDTLPLLLSTDQGSQGSRPTEPGLSTRPGVRLPATPEGALRGVELSAVGAVAVREVKSQARAFWESLDDDTGTAQPRLAGRTQRIWLDQRVRATLADSVPQIGAPTAWEAGYDGKGVTVAVLDTGYDPHHPDLVGQVSEARNFTEDTTAVDEFGHGTHVAATIAGTGAASDHQSRGVAPGARLLVGKVLDHNGVGLDSQIIAGMQWAVEQGARVVNMSLGGAPSDGTDPLSQAVDSLTRASGTLFVVSAGNSGGEQTVGAPGSATSALTVGAVDKQDRMAPFSSRGPRLGDSATKPDLVAPGVDIIAARAAGTGLGDLVDAEHVSLSGTSMAAPHVAGAAAILAQEHPDWQAQQLKSALMATSHHLDGPGVAEQGTGRVDLATAVTQQVLPDTASLALGRLAWSDGPRATVTRTVSYRNDSTGPVALDLAVPVTDTGAQPHHAAALTVTPTRLTVPAGASASATVTLDPDATPPGTYAGYLTARAANGQTLRATVGFTVDGPRYPLHLAATDRFGQPPGGINPVQIWNLDTGELSSAALLGGDRTVEVPAGRYAVMGYLQLATGDELPRGVAMVGDPELHVTGETTLRLDARTAHEFSLHTQHATQKERYILAWQRTAGTRSVLTGFDAPGWMSHVYAAATDPVTTGTFRFFSRWDLGAVPLVAKVSGPHGFTLAPPSPVEGASRLDGHHRLDLVDAGLGRAEDFAHLDARGKAVLVTRHATGEDSDTPVQLANAAAAGVAVVLLTNDRPGPYLDGTSDVAVPAYTVEQDTGQRLRTLLGDQSRVTVDLVGVAESPFRYDLMLPEVGRIPADLNYDMDQKNLARVAVDYHAHTGRMTASAGRMAFPSGVDIAFELQRAVHPPLHRTEYLSTGDTRWVAHTVADTWDWLGHMYSLPRQYRPGEQDHEVWFPAITRPALPAAPPDTAHGAPVSRFGDAIRVTMPQHSDGAADHYGFADPVSETTELVLTRDGRTLGRSNGPITQFDVPGEPGDYRLTMRSERTQPWHRDWWTTSTATATTWTFGSARPVPGRYAVLPLLQVDYELATDFHNQVRAGHPTRLGLRVGYQPGYQSDQGDGGAGQSVSTQVSVSFDDGNTWRELAVHHRSDGALTVMLPEAPTGAGFGSLRIIASDQHGNRLEQTIERAYRIAPPR